MRPLKPLLLIGLVAGCLLLVYVSPLGELFKPSRHGDLQAAIARQGAWAPALFVLLCTVGVGFGAPRLAFAAIGGLAFGWWEGCLLAQAGTLGGCLVSFGWARWLGRSAVERRVGRRLGWLLDSVRQRPVATNLMLRLCPVGNNFLVNLFFGLSPIGVRDYAVGTFIGTLPLTLIVAILGSSVHDASTQRLLTAGGLLLVLALAYATWSRSSREAAEVTAGMVREAG